LLLSGNFPAHDLKELAMNERNGSGEAFYTGIQDRADMAFLQRDCVADMRLKRDGVGAQQITGHVEPGDLLAAISDGKDRLEKSGTNGIEAGKWVPGAKERFALAHASVGLENFLLLAPALAHQIAGQARVVQMADSTARRIIGRAFPDRPMP